MSSIIHSNATILGTGSCLPKTSQDNLYFENFLDTSHAWIKSRTGIEKRHIAQESETVLLMSEQASNIAINNSNLHASDIDVIIVATCTPDKTLPSTGILLQAKLVCRSIPAFDIQAACSGFLYALTLASNFLISGQYKNILVVGVDKMTSILDWKDRNTCILFGDGAGAVVLSKNKATSASGVLSSLLYSDGSLADALDTTGGVSSTRTAGVMRMNGRIVFENAVLKMYSALTLALEECNLKKEDVKLFIPHQANIRIIQAVAKKMDLCMDKFAVTIHEHANTSAASIPLALDAYRSQLTTGDVIALVAIGAGLCWGATIIKI